MITSTITVLVTIVVFGIIDFISAKNNLIFNIENTGSIISNRLDYALSFFQPGYAQAYINDLANLDSINTACVFDSEGLLFVQYERFSEGYCQNDNLKEQFSFLDNIFIKKFIIGDSSGTLFIISDLNHLYSDIFLYIYITLVIFVVIIFVSYFIANFLQQYISHPIIDLTHITKSIAKEKDYSVRAERVSDDEIGTLSDNFNIMLSEIHSRDNQLKEANNYLEQKVSERTADLSKALETVEYQAEELAISLKKEEQQAAELTEALAIKERFIDNMNHELRTPLHNIIPAIRRIIKHWNEYEDKEKLRQLGNIRFAGMRLQDLVNDLLDLSKIQSGKYVLCVRKVKLSDLVNYTLRELEPNLNKGRYKTQLNIPHMEEEITCDAVKISRVIRNLISNAIKYGEGNPITITISKHTDGNHMICEVIDSGLGIPPGEEEHIFDHFVESSRTKKREKGIGLGLSICREIIELHKGTITANNNGNGHKEGEGSTFTVIIPIHQDIGEFVQWSDDTESFAKPDEDDAMIENIIANLPANTNATTPTAPKTSTTVPIHAHASKSSPLHIVLADDEELNLQALEFSLHTIASHVSTFPNGTDAWNFIQNNADNIDIVILDNMMPGMYGLDILANMRKKPTMKHIPVIMQTAKKMTEEDLQYVKKQHALLLKKPFDDDDLVSLVQTAINSKNSSPPEPSQPSQPSKPSKPELPSHHIVVADDEELNLDLLSYSLDKISNNVAYFQDGTSTWEYIQGNPDKIDIVILDNMMPGMYGMDILEKMRQEPSLQSIPVVLQTAKSLKPDAIQAIESQSAAYLKKPFDDDELINVVTGFIHNKKLSDTHVVLADNHELKILLSKAIPDSIEAETTEPRLIEGLRNGFDQLKEHAPVMIEHLENGDPGNQELNSNLWHKLYNIHHLINLYAKNLGYKNDYLTHAIKLIELLEKARPPKEEEMRNMS